MLLQYITNKLKKKQVFIKYDFIIDIEYIYNNRYV